MHLIYSDRHVRLQPMANINRLSTTIRLDEDLIRGCQRLHARDGIPMSETIRRALREFLTMKEVYPEKLPTVMKTRTRQQVRQRSKRR